MPTCKFLILLSILCLWALTCCETKTVFRRTDKLSNDNYKRVRLPANEIDPNVAPPQTQLNSDAQVAASDTVAVSAAVEEAATSIPIQVVMEETDNDNAIFEAITEVATTTLKPLVESTTQKIEPAAANLSQYCKCTDTHCDCCREFRIPLLPVIRGPACARVAFLGDDKMSISLKYSDLTLATRTISGKRAKPICVGLPGGYSQFCGRVYGLARTQDNFKACLGFELRADDEVEAALRVSCFKFGPRGLRVAESEPLPSEIKDDDDDDDDIFGFGGGAEDDEEDEDDEGDDYDDDSPENDDDDDEDVTPIDPDYDGFSLGNLIEELADDDDTKKKKPVVKPAVVAQTRQVDNKVELMQNVTNTLKSKKIATKKKKSSDNDNDGESEIVYEMLNRIFDFF